MQSVNIINFINLSSAEFSQRMLKGNGYLFKGGDYQSVFVSCLKIGAPKRKNLLPFSEKGWCAGKQTECYKSFLIYKMAENLPSVSSCLKIHFDAKMTKKYPKLSSYL